MRDSIPGLVLVVLFATGSCCAAAVDKDLEITIYLRDYSGLDSSAVADAHRVAEFVFQRAGITARWQHCARPASGGAPACGAGSSLTQLDVAVLPERMAAKIAPGPMRFGISTAGRDGGFPTQAY